MSNSEANEKEMGAEKRASSSLSSGDRKAMSFVAVFFSIVTVLTLMGLVFFMARMSAVIDKTAS